jgi:hypothetical protein
MVKVTSVFAQLRLMMRTAPVFLFTQRRISPWGELARAAAAVPIRNTPESSNAFLNAVMLWTVP